SVPKTMRDFLLMNYKFLVLPNSQMCCDHVAIDDYWSLVKQINNEVSAEEQILVSDLMFDIHRSTRNDHTFNIDNLDSIHDSDFKAWFAFDKGQFRTISDMSNHAKLSTLQSCSAKCVLLYLTNNYLSCSAVASKR